MISSLSNSNYPAAPFETLHHITGALHLPAQDSVFFNLVSDSKLSPCSGTLPSVPVPLPSRLDQAPSHVALGELVPSPLAFITVTIMLYVGGHLTKTSLLLKTADAT